MSALAFEGSVQASGLTPPPYAPAIVAFEHRGNAVTDRWPWRNRKAEGVVPLPHGLAQADLTDPRRERRCLRRPVADRIAHRGELLQLRATHELHAHVDDTLVADEKVPPDQGHARSQVQDDLIELVRRSGGRRPARSPWLPGRSPCHRSTGEVSPSCGPTL